MKSYRNDDLIRLLADGQADLRMLALHLLCEGYANSSEIFQQILSGWDRWGADRAFHEFPMLTFFPIPHDAVAECCERAAHMAENRKLTDPITRCAGRLIEQMMHLPPAVLAEQQELIGATVTKSKIFFRVDLDGLRERVSFLEKSAEELSSVLNQAVGALCGQSDDRSAATRGLHALEALRTNHSSYLDLSSVLEDHPPTAGSKTVSFQMTVQSLIHREEAGLAAFLGKHLGDERDAIYPNIVEALVRLGDAQTADAFITNFDDCEQVNQRWIARGLQRIRVEDLAERIAQLRDRVTDPALWLMLLIAEIRQFDVRSSDRICSELERLQSFSETLIDTLTVYARLNEGHQSARAFQQCFMDYIQRSNQSLAKLIAEKQSGQRDDGATSSMQWWQNTLLRYRENL